MSSAIEDNKVVELINKLIFNYETNLVDGLAMFDWIKKALLALEQKRKFEILLADIKERIALHQTTEPSEYILADLNLFIKQREKEMGFLK